MTRLLLRRRIQCGVFCCGEDVSYADVMVLSRCEHVLTTPAFHGADNT